MLALKYSFRLVSNKKTEDTDSVVKLSQNEEKRTKNVEINDKKRSFLKLAGIVGVGVVASQLLPKKAEALVFGSTPASNVVGIKNKNNEKINPAQETGGNLDTIAGKDFATQTTLNAIKGQSDKLSFGPTPGTGGLIVSNDQAKFADGFAVSGTQPDPSVWDLVNPTANHIITQGGNAFSSAYLRISLSPFDTDSEVSITTKSVFRMPFRAGWGISMSQRIAGQEVGMEMVGVDVNNAVETITPISDIAMPASCTVATANTLPIVTAAPHGLRGGDRVCIYGCLDSRVNAGPVVVTVLTATSFTVPVTLAVATYNTTNGYIKWVDPVASAKNATSLLCENTTATNASFITRRSGASFRSVNSTIATTTANQANTSPYTDAFLNAGNQELYTSVEEVIYRSFAPDGVATMSGLGKWTQSVPDDSKYYKIRVRAKNLKCLTVPVARISTIAKTGTTTATVTTDITHGLNTLDYIQIYGVQDQTNFPNLSTAVVVTGTPTSNTFTCVIGTATTNNSVGGVVWRVQGSATAPGVVAGSIQSISRTSNILSVVNGSTWATPLPGEYYQLWGMNGAAAAYDGAYKVLRVSTTTLELDSTGPDFGSISCGGVGFKRTDIRVHFVRVLDYTRLVTEVVGGKGNTTDMNNAVPVALTGGTVTTVSSITAGTITTLQNMGTGMTAVGFIAYPTMRENWYSNVRNRIT